MLKRRIIPCLDVSGGRTVKGTNFVNLRDAGSPIELARRYSDEGADELVFLDISATPEGRELLPDLIRSVAVELRIPFTVGGGVRSVTDVGKLLSCGADKISVNSSAVRDPTLIDRLAGEFGSQCVVVAVDIRTVDGEWVVTIDGGRTATERRALEWVRELANRGAGEILLTSMDHDGTKGGFALELTAAVSKAVQIPVIASGGAGHEQDFVDVFREGCADAALAAGIFHFQELTIPSLKNYLNNHGIPARAGA